LVANSPGLIAGSNVLHRLLMPRHPPCALHSLSQQRQDNTHKETTPAHPPIKGADQHDAAHRKTGHAIELQLNYLQPGNLVTKMLASTMQISNNNPTNTLNPHNRDLEQRETPEEHNPTADPSGPNSVLDPIPHQRRAMSNQTTHTQTSWTQETRPSTIPLVNTTIRARTFA
jgi:hypothetical protein